TPDGWIAVEAKRLGVSEQSLRALRVTYSRKHRATAIPMRDGYGNLTGFRLRAPDGRKWAVETSQNSLFLPWLEPARTAFLVEGATDCMAAITLGYFGIGRHSCSGGISPAVDAIKRLGVTGVIICGDNDIVQEWDRGRNPGLAGAEMLAKYL